MIEATKQCEGQVVDKFPLRQHLGETETSTVFLTARDGEQKAAIKFVALDGNEATKQLSHWKRTAQLSHPHLLKIFESGRCQLGGRNQVYVVTEFADENLSEILPHRALTETEAREMLTPLLDGLGYLHGNGFVHGNLKPGNIMAADNQLKLASDSVRQAGEPFAAGKKRSRYDAPESASQAALSASADIWSLGITLIEVLTQRAPDWETRAGEPVVPLSLPEPFREIAGNCLKRDPNARWTVPQIKTRLSQASRAASPAVSKPISTPAQSTSAETRSGRSFMPIVIAVIALAVILGAIALLRKRPASSTNATTATAGEQSTVPATSSTESTPKPQAAVPRSGSSTGTGTRGDVVQQVAPKISPSAQRTIRGRIKLRVRVHVNGAGDVTRADLVTAGPSQYFARLVMEAARQWKFTPSAQAAERRWMLEFSLTRHGNSASAQPTK